MDLNLSFSTVSISSLFVCLFFGQEKGQDPRYPSSFLYFVSLSLNVQRTKETKHETGPSLFHQIYCLPSGATVFQKRKTSRPYNSPLTECLRGCGYTLFPSPSDLPGHGRPYGGLSPVESVVKSEYKVEDYNQVSFVFSEGSC